MTDYVLKPVDPDRFHDTIQKIQKEIASRKNKEQQSIKEKSFLQQYFLLGYIYSGDQERLKEAEGIVDFSVWEQWHCAILIESDESFFDSASDEVPLEIQEELRRSFFYLNLNGRQSLLLFKDVYCDYTLVAKNVYSILKRLHPVRFHLAVSDVLTDTGNCPGSWNSWSSRWKRNFIIRISMSTPVRKRRRKIPAKRNRIPDLWKNLRRYFQKGCEAAVEPFPQPGIKISVQYPVFGHVCEICFFQCDKGAVSGESFAGEHRLDLEVDHLYGCSTIQEIIEVQKKNIRQYEEFLDRSMSESRDEVAAVKNYIYNHYAEDLNLETLAEKYIFLLVISVLFSRRRRG